MHFLFLPFVLPALALHFLPAIIAGVRHARNFGWILVINLLLSWTVIGWIVALIWSICDTPRYYYVPYVPPPGPPYNVR
ncbi:MAG TPA: superinfection immunity protein [Acidobacteriaceae bacterium]|nr:superinfection immunity protein [Acidobacteriaceae bacterium]